MPETSDPLTYDTVAGWQKYFDATFPHGLLVTQVLNTEASAHNDNSPQVLMSNIRAVEIQDDGDLVISMAWVGLDKDTMLDVERIEPRDRGCYVVAADDSPDYLLSSHLTPIQREAVIEARREGTT